jgi:rhodanese-related sulfurtransferase
LPKHRVLILFGRNARMPDETTLSLQALFDRIGTAEAPDVIDTRTDDDFAADPRLIPTAIRRPGIEAADWASGFAGRDVVVYCERGLKISQGAAAWLRHVGARAASLEGGFQAWRAAGLTLVPEAKLPPRDGQGRTLWVTRSRPKIDRIACPWLIRRFVDPTAVFLFVAPAEVAAVADRFGATPFDIEGVFWSHRGDSCTFDAMVEEFGLGTEPMLRLAAIVRGADTARPGLAPEAAGLLAASLGLSRMFSDDMAQLEAGMALYDVFYLWARDAAAETHNWPAAKQEIRDVEYRSR